MKKNIIIGVLVVMCGFLYVYGLVQQTAAVKAQREALSNLELAKKNESEARHIQALAEANAQEARRAIEDCAKRIKK